MENFLNCLPFANTWLTPACYVGPTWLTPAFYVGPTWLTPVFFMLGRTGNLVGFYVVLCFLFCLSLSCVFCFQCCPVFSGLSMLDCPINWFEPPYYDCLFHNIWTSMSSNFYWSCVVEFYVHLEEWSVL